MLGETLRLLTPCSGVLALPTIDHGTWQFLMWPRRFPLNVEQSDSVVPWLWDTPLLALVTCLT